MLRSVGKRCAITNFSRSWLGVSRIFYCSKSVDVNLRGHLVSVADGNQARYGVIRNSKDLPVIKASIPSEPPLKQQTHPLNQKLKNTKEIEVELFGCRNVIFPPSAISYLFFQEKTPHIDSNVPKQIELYCKAFEEVLEDQKHEIHKSLLDETAKEGTVFTAAEFRDNLEEWKLSTSISNLSQSEIYPLKVMTEYALYWWVTYGNGRELFRYYREPKLFSFCAGKEITKYPLLFASIYKEEKKPEPKRKQKKVAVKGTDSDSLNTVQNEWKSDKDMDEKRVFTKEVRDQMYAIMESSQFETSTKLKRDVINEKVFVVDKNLDSNGEDGFSLGEKTEKGQWIHIHFSDVVHCISNDSPLDIYARNLPISAYLFEFRETMLPEKLNQYLALTCVDSKVTQFNAITFSVLIGEKAKVLEHQIRPTIIPKEKIQRLTMHQVDCIINERSSEELGLLYEYYLMLKDKRNHYIKDETFYVGENVQAKTAISCKGDSLVREMMLLAGIIAGNIGHQMKLPMIFREYFGPIIQMQLDETLGINQRQVKRSARTGCLISKNELVYKNFAPVSSPLRKYIDLLNHRQLLKVMEGEAPQNSTELGDIVDSTKRKKIHIEDKKFRSKREGALRQIEEDIGLNGIVVGRIMTVAANVVSGKKTAQIEVKLINYPTITIPLKIKRSKKQPIEAHSTMQFVITELDVSKNRIAIDIAKKQQ